MVADEGGAVGVGLRAGGTNADGGILLETMNPDGLQRASVDCYKNPCHMSMTPFGVGTGVVSV